MIENLMQSKSVTLHVFTDEQLEAYSTNLINKMISLKEQAAPEEEYVTMDEVSSKLQVTKTTLWRWAKVGYLNPIKVGGKSFYKSSDINKLMEG